MTSWYRRHKDGVDLLIRLTPKAQKDVVEEVKPSADGKSRLAARVRAIPEKGRANKALEKLVAQHFGFPKSSVNVSAGSTSRLKTVTITGNPDEIGTVISTNTKISIE